MANPATAFCRHQTLAHARNVRPRPRTRPTLLAEGGRHQFGLFQKPHYRQRDGQLGAAGARSRPARTHAANVPRRQNQHDGTPRRPARRPAQPRQHAHHGGRRRRDAQSERRVAQNGAFRPRRAQRRMAGVQPPSDYRRGEYRHRRFRFGAVDDVYRAEKFRPSAPAHALRLQRGRLATARRAGKSPSRNHIIHHRLQNLHHAGNHHQRQHRPPMVPARSQRAGHRQTLRCRVHQQNRRGRIRHRYRPHV